MKRTIECLTPLVSTPFGPTRILTASVVARVESEIGCEGKSGEATEGERGVQSTVRLTGTSNLSHEGGVGRISEVGD